MDIDAFMDHLERSPDKSTETTKAYRSDLILFSRFLQSKKLRVTQVTPIVVHEYVQELLTQPNLRFGKIGLSRATIRRRLIAIRRYFAFLIATKNPKLRDPTFGLKVGNLNNDECKAVDETVITDLLAGITNRRDKVLISLFLNSGLRLSELYQLDRSSIEQEEHESENGQIHILGTGEVIGKRQKKRRFYIDAEMVNDLVDYLATRDDDLPALFVSERRQRMSKRAIQDTLSIWCRRLGISPTHIHQLRHQFATRLANAGIDSMVLKTLMGHEDLRTTTRYFKLYEQTIARQYHAAMEVLKPPPDCEITQCSSQ